MWFEVTTVALLVLLSVAVAVPYLAAYRGLKSLSRFRQVFITQGDEPMGVELYKLYTQVKSFASAAADDKGIGRLLSIEIAPGLTKHLIDVSSKGQFSTLIEEIQKGPPLRPEQKLVIDIGANDGFQGSNSFNLLQLGWRGALIEPHPQPYAEMKRHTWKRRMHGYQKNVLIRRVGVSRNTDGRFNLKVEGWRHTGSHIELDGGEEDGAPRHAILVESVKTLVMRLQASFRERGVMDSIPLDFGVLALDAEGMDFEILQGFLDEGFRPLHIIAEERDVPGAFDDLLGKLGYERIAYFDSDLIFARRDSS